MKKLLLTILISFTAFITAKSQMKFLDIPMDRSIDYMIAQLERKGFHENKNLMTIARINNHNTSSIIYSGKFYNESVNLYIIPDCHRGKVQQIEVSFVNCKNYNTDLEKRLESDLTRKYGSAKDNKWDFKYGEIELCHNFLHNNTLSLYYRLPQVDPADDL